MIKTGDRVKQKHTSAQRTGKVIGIWENDEYIITNNNEKILFAIKGELKVKFDYHDSGNSYHTFSEIELEKII